MLWQNPTYFVEKLAFQDPVSNDDYFPNVVRAAEGDNDKLRAFVSRLNRPLFLERHQNHHLNKPSAKKVTGLMNKNMTYTQIYNY